MKSAYIGGALAAVVAAGLAVGCNKGGTAGGPGASNTSNQQGPRVGAADDTFSLKVPTLATKVKQTESQVVSIGIDRGKNFAQDVALKFENLPEGVTIDPAAPTLKSSDTEAKVTVKASDMAAVGDFTVKAVGHPAKGADAANELKIAVEKK